MKWFTKTAAVALLSSVLVCTTVSAATPEHSGFSAIQGVEAQALSADEMQQISGELNAYDIAAALYTEAGKLGKFPKLQADTIKLADWTKAHAEDINKVFAKFHILTPCQSCTK